MAGATKKFCPVCKDLGRVTRDHQKPGYVRMDYLGNPGVDMKRIYARDSGGTYRGIGHICQNNHVVLDDVERSGHVPVPTYPHQVICLATGETVAVPV